MSHLPLKNEKKHALPWRENQGLFDMTTLKDSELIMWYPLSSISIMLSMISSLCDILSSAIFMSQPSDWEILVDFLV